MNIGILCGIIFFNIFNNSLKKFLKAKAWYKTETLVDKLLDNVFVSGMHCYICVFNIILYMFTLQQNYLDNAIIFSSSYYIYDLIRIVNNYHYNAYDNIYLLHHLVAICVLQYNILQYGIFYFIIGEFSNIFYYPVYYCNKLNTDVLTTRMLKKLQFISYFFCRVIIMSYYVYLTVLIETTPILIFTSPIYLMGVFWSYKLYLNL